MLKKYGITVKVFLLMVEAQAGCCAICKKHYGIDLQIDHDHKTGAVRELLCQTCNVGIGALKESIATLKNAIKYIKRHASKSFCLTEGTSTPNLNIPGSVVSTATHCVGANLGNPITP